MPRIAVAFYVVLWLIAFLVRASLPGGTMVLPLFSLVVFGIALPPLAWWLTRRVQTPTLTIPKPRTELIAILLYLAIFAIVVLGWAFTALKTALPELSAHELALDAVKAVTMIVLPVALLRLCGSDIATLLAPRFQANLLPALIGLGLIILLISTFVTGAFEAIAALPPVTLAWAIPACFLWLAITAGLCEEVLFRVALQTRLEAVLQTTLPAILIASLIFALVHVPGLVLRADTSDPSLGTLLGAVAYAIAVLSPPGVFLGLVWMRTRSLALVAILHTLVDLPPNLAEFAHRWT
ncbi:MAG TPA: CPBP family intramembrane glutamic endopeptidase [Rhizomicrobium sp.]|nr:CPBP family intramembrane glutamic endopeptidase [Rhizomicrobium sp.]